MAKVGKVARCPSGEQIVNGGFETGDFTSWSRSGTCASITTSNPHSGTYCASVFDYGCYIEQNNINVLVECVQTLTFWGRNDYGDVLNTHIPRITFTDLSTVETMLNSKTTWQLYDIEYLLSGQEGKTIKSIRLTCNLVNWTMFFDDVSLTGTG